MRSPWLIPPPADRALIATIRECVIGAQRYLCALELVRMEAARPAAVSSVLWQDGPQRPPAGQFLA